MNEYSLCVKEVIETVPLALPYMYASQVESGIHEILDRWMLKYVKHLKGVLVNYRNVEIDGEGSFLLNSPHIRYNVKGTFDIFCPKVGDIAKGTIIRISKYLIGCLVQNTVNVTIYLPGDSSWGTLTKYIQLEREILFEITSVELDRGILKVTGSVTPLCVELMDELFKYPRTQNVKHYYYDEADEPLTNDEPPKKQGKKDELLTLSC